MASDTGPAARHGATGHCPSCGRPTSLGADNPTRPFCSPRCRLIDLGEWLDERRRIPGPPTGDPSAPDADFDADPEA